MFCIYISTILARREVFLFILLCPAFVTCSCSIQLCVGRRRVSGRPSSYSNTLFRIAMFGHKGCDASLTDMEETMEIHQKIFEKQAFLLPFNMSSEVKWNGSPLAFLIDRLFRAAARRWLVCSGKIIALFSFSFSYSFRERMFQIFLHNHGVKNCISTFWLCSSTSLQAHCAVHGMKMLPFAKDSLCCFLLARVYGCM